MFEVLRYEHPIIFVTSRQTGETYRFLVGRDGALVNSEPYLNEDARRTAAQYLFRQAVEAQVRDLLLAG